MPDETYCFMAQLVFRELQLTDAKREGVSVGDGARRSERAPEKQIAAAQSIEDAKVRDGSPCSGGLREGDGRAVRFHAARCRRKVRRVVGHCRARVGAAGDFRAAARVRWRGGVERDVNRRRSRIIAATEHVIENCVF